MGKPLVSVITIFRNAQRFIEEAVDSVLSQTYANWEFLLVDDGSTDNSTQVALQYAARYPAKLHYLEHRSHENRGTASSRNLGLRHSKGELVAFLDADDVWLPEKLERQVAMMAKYPEVAMAYEATVFWGSWQEDGQDIDQDLGVQPNLSVGPPNLLPVFLTDEDATPATCSVMFRRAALEQAGGFDESFAGMYEDQALYAKICLEDSVFVAEGFLSKYRKHSDSLCSIMEKDGQCARARQLFLTWLADYLTQRRITDVNVWRALETQMWPYRHPFLKRTLGTLLHLFGHNLPAKTRRHVGLRILRKFGLPASITVPEP
jgi:glycosyltransferase involved in cell wall biosynthesis